LNRSLQHRQQPTRSLYTSLAKVA